MNIFFTSTPLFPTTRSTVNTSNELPAEVLEEWKEYLDHDEALKGNTVGQGEHIAHSLMGKIIGIHAAQKAITLKTEVQPQPCPTQIFLPNRPSYKALTALNCISSSSRPMSQPEANAEVSSLQENTSMENKVKMFDHDTLFKLVIAALKQQLKPDQQLSLPAHLDLQEKKVEKEELDDSATTLLTLEQGGVKEQRSEWYEDIYKTIALCLVEAYYCSLNEISGPIVGNIMAGKFWTSFSVYRLPLEFVAACDESLAETCEKTMEQMFTKLKAVKQELEEVKQKQESVQNEIIEPKKTMEELTELRKQLMDLKVEEIDLFTKRTAFEVLYGTPENPVVTHMVDNLHNFKTPGQKEDKEVSPEGSPRENEEKQEILPLLLLEATKNNCQQLGSHLRSITGRIVDHFHTIISSTHSANIEKPFKFSTELPLLRYKENVSFLTDGTSFFAKMGGKAVTEEAINARIIQTIFQQPLGIAKVFGKCLIMQGKSCIVYEHAGEELFSQESHVKERGNLLLQVADTLQKLHASNLHYTDLKEPNICVKEGQAKLIDLESLQLEKQFFGKNKMRFTHGFIPPEVFLCKEAKLYSTAISELGLPEELKPDRKFDMWAFGLLALRSFFEDKQHNSDIRLLFTGKILKTIREWKNFNGYDYCCSQLEHVKSSHIPAKWVELIRGCLAGKPSERLTAAKVVEMLKNITGSE